MITLTALFFISLTPLKSQVFYNSNQQSVNVHFEGVEKFNEETLQRMEKRLEQSMKKIEQFFQQNGEITIDFDQNYFIITFSSIEDNTFHFMGDHYKDLNEIDEGIETEEEELKKNGYFQFMNDWYPSLELIDSINKQYMQAGSFKFMDERYAPMPGEVIFG